MKTMKMLGLIGIIAVFAIYSCKKSSDDTSVKISHIIFMDVDSEAIQSVAIDSGKVHTLKKLTEMYGSGIAYDSKNQKIYFSDFYDEDTPNGKIWKANADGTGAQAIVTGILNPFGIALDLDNSKVYWGDDDGNVSRANLDGTGVEKGIFNVDGGGIRAIAVDGVNKKLYFYDVQHNNLYKSDLDGKNATPIITGYYGYAIYIDNTNSKLYFDAQTDDETISALYRANLDGTGVTEVDNTVSRIYGIAIDYDTNKLYWSARDSSKIYQANLNGTSKVAIAKNLGSPRGIILK